MSIEKPLTTDKTEGSALQNTEAADTYKELHDMAKQESTENERHNRLAVVQGLTEPVDGRLPADSRYRFLITAAVQSDPVELGRWLLGSGSEFTVNERPVNTSLIDQEHNWTFEGLNGFILGPPERGEDVIAAQPHDMASNDLEPQPITADAEQLLAATSRQGYNHVNVTAGKLKGVFIRCTEEGAELGSPEANAKLRSFADQHGLPKVELAVKPQRLEAGEISIEHLTAKAGNKLWKVRLPENGALREVDIIQFQPTERPKGFTADASGFDLRVQDIDPYGQSRYVIEDKLVLTRVLERLKLLMPVTEGVDAEAVEFAIRRIEAQIEKNESSS
jgi:hypothetical protein